jgi:branched-chain amino acid transport system permease protein
MRQQVPYLMGVGLIIFFVAFPFVYSAGDYDYIMHILITAFFYAILASSWSMLAGYAGQFSFGHIGFMGIGAYTAALFSHYFYLSPEATGLCTEYQFGGTWLIIVNPIGVTSSTLTQDCLRQAMAIWDGSVQVTPMPIWLGILLSTLMGGIFGLLIGLLVLRLRAAYLALFTLGFAEILKATISAEIEITRGQAGMELPSLFENGVTIFGHAFSRTDKLPPYFVMFALLLTCLAILAWLSHSKFGLFVRALREDQDAAAALGVNTTRYKVMVFVITTMMAAAGGRGTGPLQRHRHPEPTVPAADESGRRHGGDRWGRELRRRRDRRHHHRVRAGNAAQQLRHRRLRGRYDDLAAGVLRHPADADPALRP